MDEVVIVYRQRFGQWSGRLVFFFLEGLEGLEGFSSRPVATAGEKITSTKAKSGSLAGRSLST